MELNRHPSLYFEDGDIVLSAYATLTSRQLFRVHRVFLSHYSEVFRGMFAVVSTTNIDEAYDGTPLLRMPDDDTAEAVASLLDVMYNSSSLLRQLTTPRQSEVPFKQMDLVRIAKKYMVQDIASAVIEHVKSKWPLDIDGYDMLQEEFKRVAKLNEKDLHPELYFPEPASAVAFALEHDVHSVLPAAFYTLVATNANLDWDDFRRFDNSSCIKPARWSLLNRDALFRLLKGKDRMAVDFEDILQAIHMMWSFGTGDRFFKCSLGVDDVCEPACETLWRDILETVLHDEEGSDANYFVTLNKIADRYRQEEDLCKSCREGMYRMVREERQMMWNRHKSSFSRF